MTHKETEKHHITYSVELLLQFFICIIDTELLKTVLVKRLKPAQKGDSMVS